MSDEQADRDRGTTHWEGCWRSHPRCAESRVERYREALVAYDDAVRYACRYYVPSTSAVAEVKAFVNGYLEEDPENCPEELVREIRSHRALSDGENDA